MAQKKGCFSNDDDDDDDEINNTYSSNVNLLFFSKYV
jgi:hypothetical protein